MSSIVSVLERELGKEAVIGPGHERLDDYGRDESPLGASACTLAACESTPQENGLFVATKSCLKYEM